MRRRALILAFTGLVLIGAGCSGGGGDAPAAPAGNAQLELGRDVWIVNCSRCHGADGSGRSGPRLNDGHVVEQFPDPADEADVVRGGRGIMPSFGSRLSDEEIDAVVAYTREVL